MSEILSEEQVRALHVDLVHGSGNAAPRIEDSHECLRIENETLCAENRRLREALQEEGRR